MEPARRPAGARLESFPPFCSFTAGSASRVAPGHPRPALRVGGTLFIVLRAHAFQDIIVGMKKRTRKPARLIRAEQRYDASAKRNFPAKPDFRTYAELLAAQADQYDAWGRRLR